MKLFRVFRAVWLAAAGILSAISGLEASSWNLTSAGDSLPGNRNSIEAGFRNEDFYRNYNDRTFLYVQLGRKFRKVDVFAKVLRYSLGSLEGYQFESEAYWRLSRKTYSYLDAAYSDDRILPNYRLRAEIFHSVGKFEYSVGGGLVKPHNFKVIPLVTGTVGYYFSDYFIYARPTVSYVDNGYTKSIFIQARRYFNATNFIAVSALKGADTGTSRNLNAIANTFGYDTYLFRLNTQLKKGRYKFGPGIDHGGIYIPEGRRYARFIGVDVFVAMEF